MWHSSSESFRNCTIASLTCSPHFLACSATTAPPGGLGRLTTRCPHTHASWPLFSWYLPPAAHSLLPRPPPCSCCQSRHLKVHPGAAPPAPRWASLLPSNSAPHTCSNTFTVAFIPAALNPCEIVLFSFTRFQSF